MSEITPELVEAIKAKAVDGRITCPVLRKLAEDRGLTYKLVGQAADDAGVKIKNCELGCF